jgi:hypothetical protein
MWCECRCSWHPRKGSDGRREVIEALDLRGGVGGCDHWTGLVIAVTLKSAPRQFC